MIKPLTNVSVSVLGNEVAIADGDKNGGKTAYGQLLAGEDISVTDETSTLFIPYHAVEYAVIERSSETVEDPVDSLCKSENDEPDQCENIVISIAPQDAMIEDRPASFYQHDDVVISGNVISGTLTCPSPRRPSVVLDVSGSVVPEGFEEIAFFNGPHYDYDHMLIWDAVGDIIAVQTILRGTAEPIESLGIGFVRWDGDEEYGTYSDCRSLYDLNLTYDPCGD